MKFSRLSLNAKIKIVRYLRNTLYHKTVEIFNCENFLSYGHLKTMATWILPGMKYTNQ